MTATRTARRAAAAALTAAAAALALSLGGTAAPASAAVQLNCAAAPSSCGYPDATNTGVPAGTTLQTVPGQVSSGPGWSYSASTGTTTVTGNGAVLNDLSITGNLNVQATNVTLSNDKIITSGTYGVSLRHASGTTITNSDIGGQNATTGRVNYAIDDIYGDSTRLVIKDDAITDWRVGINADTGQITGNYIHDPGFLAGDHTDGIYDAEGTTQLTISDNTILNSLDQACAIMLQSAAGVPVSNMTVTGNLLGGGGYVIYAGGAQNDSTKIKITNNRFSQQYYSLSGQYGPDAQYQATGAGNTWTGNVWDTTGTTVSP
jgi:Right handed beta helix region